MSTFKVFYAPEGGPFSEHEVEIEDSVDDSVDDNEFIDALYAAFNAQHPSLDDE